MNIPNKIKVAGYDYIIERPLEPFASDTQVCDGIHKFSEQIIKIARAGNEAYQNTVFLHELVHAIISSYCSNISEEINEQFTEQFSKGLYQVITDNPEIFKKEVENSE